MAAGSAGVPDGGLAGRDRFRSEPHGEHRLLVQWARGAEEPAKSRLSNLSADTSLEKLVDLAHHRWIIERNDVELNRELAPGHFEGRSWRGFHPYAGLCIAAFGFLVAERSRSSRGARTGLNSRWPGSERTDGCRGSH